MGEIQSITGLVDKEQLKDILSVFAQAINSNTQKVSSFTGDNVSEVATDEYDEDEVTAIITGATIDE